MSATTQRARTAVIPAAGLGTRFLPVTKAQPKEMLPVVDKPAIQYVVEEAVRAGIDDILIITSRGKQGIEDHFDRSIELEVELRSKGKDDLAEEVVRLADLADVHYIRQGEALGLGHAVGVARKHVGDRPFVVMLGDDIMHERSRVLEGMLDAHERTGSPVIAVKPFPLDEISAYGVIDPGEDVGQPDEGTLVPIRGLVEKPAAEEAPSTLAVMGRYVLTAEIFDAIDRVPPGKGGEIQLTDAIALLLEDPGVHAYPFREGRYDIGNKLDYLRATVELALEREDLGPPFRAWLEGHLGAGRSG